MKVVPVTVFGHQSLKQNVSSNKLNGTDTTVLSMHNPLTHAQNEVSIVENHHNTSENKGRIKKSLDTSVMNSSQHGNKSFKLSNGATDGN